MLLILTLALVTTLLKLLAVTLLLLFLTHHPQALCSFVLELTHSSGTVSPLGVKFPADTAPTLTAGKTHLFMFVTDEGGSRYRGASLVDYTN